MTEVTANLEEAVSLNILTKPVEEIKVVQKKTAKSATHYHANMALSVSLDPDVPMGMKLLLTIVNMMKEKMEMNLKIQRKLLIEVRKKTWKKSSVLMRKTSVMKTLSQAVVPSDCCDKCFQEYDRTHENQK